MDITEKAEDLEPKSLQKHPAVLQLSTKEAHKSDWICNGDLIVQINNNEVWRKTIFLHRIKARLLKIQALNQVLSKPIQDKTKPINITSSIRPGMNSIQFIQLCDIRRLFVVHACPEESITSASAGVDENSVDVSTTNGNVQEGDSQ